MSPGRLDQALGAGAPAGDRTRADPDLVVWSGYLLRLWTEATEDLRTGGLGTADRLAVVEALGGQLSDALARWVAGVEAAAGGEA